MTVVVREVRLNIVSRIVSGAFADRQARWCGESLVAGAALPTCRYVGSTSLNVRKQRRRTVIAMCAASRPVLGFAACSAALAPPCRAHPLQAVEDSRAFAGASA